MNELKKLFNVICIVGISSCFIYSCDSQSNGSNFFEKTIKREEVTFDKNEEKLLYNGKPFTGTIEAGDGEGDIKVEDGKPLYEEKSYQNGYRMKKYADGTKEYYDYNNNRITANEFYDGIAR